jgi:hypothetical protein
MICTRVYRLILASILALAACAPGQPPTPPPTPTLPPLNIPFELGGQVFGFTAPDKMQEAGMTWVKRQVVYNQADDPDVYAPLIADAHNKGFKILLTFVGSPAAIANNPTVYYDDFATALRSIALHNPDAIQVWNEPNIDREWPTGSISGGNYTQMLKAAYEAIKAANPSVMVVSAAPAPTGFFVGCKPEGCDDDVFIRQMAEAGAEQYLDCVGTHYNEGILSPDATSGDPRGNPTHYTRYYLAMVDLYARIFPNKPLCFDELGYLTPEGYATLPPGFEWAAEMLVADQAAWLARAAELSRAGGRVRLMIVWNVDSTTYGADPQAGYAIVRPGGDCPACAALGRVMP